MKVQTHLKAGSQVSNVAKQTADLIVEADQQAEDITSRVVNTATSFWNCLSNSWQGSK